MLLINGLHPSEIGLGQCETSRRPSTQFFRAIGCIFRFLDCVEERLEVANVPELMSDAPDRLPCRIGSCLRLSGWRGIAAEGI
jgi:hypothetical protein